MTKGLFAVVLALAALAVVSFAVMSADAGESEAFDMHADGMVPPEEPMFSVGDPMERSPAGPGPRGQGADGALQSMMDRPAPPAADMQFMDRPGEPMGPRPDSERPRYNHDADPETMEDFINHMDERDISEFDPGFVADVIEFAEENGMEDVADRLSKKFYENFASYLDTLGSLSTMDTRASGMDDESDEESDFEVVEDEEEEDPFQFLPSEEMPEPQFIKPVSAPAVLKCIQLDL